MKSQGTRSSSAANLKQTRTSNLSGGRLKIMLQHLQALLLKMKSSLKHLIVFEDELND